MKNVINTTAAIPANISIIDRAPEAGAGFYYVIGLTGREQAIYTLYRCGSDGTPRIDGGASYDSGYRGNMGTTLESAITNAVAWFGGMSAKLMIHQGDVQDILRVRPYTLGFGKYKGMPLADIHVEDPHYIKWLISEFKKGNEWTRRCAAWMRPQLEEIDREIMNRKTTENRANSTSQYVGEIGKRQEWTLGVYRIKTIKGQYGNPDSYVCECTDANGNNVAFYCDFDAYQSGEKIYVKGTPVSHSEYMGIKSTRINRVVAI